MRFADWLYLLAILAIAAPAVAILWKRASWEWATAAAGAIAAGLGWFLSTRGQDDGSTSSKQQNNEPKPEQYNDEPGDDVEFSNHDDSLDGFIQSVDEYGRRTSED